mmetsp:Transcript_12070/g.19041  ORF Transcript_12070/g.19041 Transcript_12070/m.19041 type:complete len:204 (-) Transcript_12070:335-946(-)
MKKSNVKSPTVIWLSLPMRTGMTEAKSNLRFISKSSQYQKRGLYCWKRLPIHASACCSSGLALCVSFTLYHPGSCIAIIPEALSLVATANSHALRSSLVLLSMSRSSTDSSSFRDSGHHDSSQPLLTRRESGTTSSTSSQKETRMDRSRAGLWLSGSSRTVRMFSHRKIMLLAELCVADAFTRPRSDPLPAPATRSSPMILSM